jgi:predicted  nucleic acid-binding Zn-ribbon protein
MHADAARSLPKAQCSPGEVRCLSCEAQYAPPLGADGATPAGCPACGASLWLAATIPSGKPSGSPARSTSQVSKRGGVFYDVGGKAEGGSVLRLLESVRCLECGAVYSKPSDGGTARENPGCPDCGYVGWVIAGTASEEEPPRRRFAASRPRDLES